MACGVRFMVSFLISTSFCFLTGIISKDVEKDFEIYEEAGRMERSNN